METQIWHDRVAVSARGLNVSSIDLYLTGDMTKCAPNDFAFQIVVRIFGVQVGTTTIAPMKDGPMTVPLLSGQLGTLAGRIDHWRALRENGSAISGSDWSEAWTVAFTVVGVADIPTSSIANLIPGIGWLAKVVLTGFGPTIKIDIGTKSVAANLPHGQAAH